MTFYSSVIILYNTTDTLALKKYNGTLLTKCYLSCITLRSLDNSDTICLIKTKDTATLNQNDNSKYLLRMENIK